MTLLYVLPFNFSWFLSTICIFWKFIVKLNIPITNIILNFSFSIIILLLCCLSVKKLQMKFFTLTNTLRILINLNIYLFSLFPSLISRKKEIDFVLQDNVNQADQLYVIEHIANTRNETREFARARWDVHRKQ